jgi:hypothetical protein
MINERSRFAQENLCGSGLVAQSDVAHSSSLSKVAYLATGRFNEVMELRADPVHRLGYAVLGLFPVLLTLRCIQITLDVDLPFRSGDFRQPPMERLLPAALIGAPLPALGFLLMARASSTGVTCTDEVIEISGRLWTRNIPTSRVTGIRRGLLGGVALRWKARKGQSRPTRVSAFSAFSFSREAALFPEHNARCVDVLGNWIDQRTSPPDSRPSQYR